MSGPRQRYRSGHRVSSSSLSRRNSRSAANAHTTANDVPAPTFTDDPGEPLGGGNDTSLTYRDFLQHEYRDDAEHATALNAHRKRRHDASSSPERRANPYTPAQTTLAPRSRPLEPPSTRSAPHPPPGATLENAIDLTTPPGAPVMSRARLVEGAGGRRQLHMPGTMAETRDNDNVLPTWQPDEDVTECHICHTGFSWMRRRHHCRKCGKVVCGDCSPHRITIPHEYIVRPSNGEGEPASPARRGLSGGETVRVCKPCVPDPWIPEDEPGSNSRDALARRLTESTEQIRRGHQTIAARQHTFENLDEQRQRYRDHFMRPPQQQPNRGRTSSLSTYSQSMPRLQPPPPPNPFMAGDPPRFLGFYDRPPPAVPGRSSRPHQHRYSHSQTGGPSIPFPNSAMSRHVPRPPRREVREEDECPVCGQELEPGDALREAHISECITSRISSTPSQSTASAPLNASTLSTSFATPAASADARARGMSFNSRVMVYSATEKDCTTASGEPQECIICMEEFQPGDELSRMECLCKFHRICIRMWFDKKGYGSCPTHQLHE